MDTYAYDHNLPCKNPNCKSYGKPHPNCECYAGGGQVCSGPHDKSCPLFRMEQYADGGAVDPSQIPNEMPADPQTTLGHVAVQKGLLGLLKEVGHSKMADPEKHHKTISRAMKHLGENEHEKAAGVMHGHPMGAGVGKTDLHDIMKHLTPSILTHESNPDALHSSVSYLGSAIKGNGILENHSKKSLGHEKLGIEPPESLDDLKGYLEEVSQDPSKLENVGGSLGHYQPMQAAALGAMSATAVQYLNSLKPIEPKAGPLDEPTPPPKTETQAWDRQLGIAQKPQQLLQHVKDGTLIPQDITTVQTIYPGLYKSMVDKVGDHLITVKSQKKEVPYKQRLALSMFLGEPLDGTMTSQAMQAVIKSAGPQQAQQKQSGPRKASAVELKQLNKVDEMSETSLQAREINRNKN